MRLWFDTVRPMPEGYDRHCRSARAALALLRSGRVTLVSIGWDDDAGESEALALAVVVESLAAGGSLQPITWRLHAPADADVSGIVAALRAADHHWTEQQSTTFAVTASGQLIAVSAADVA